MSPLYGRGSGIGQHIRHAADMRRLDGNGLQKLLVKQPRAKGEKLAAADGMKIGRNIVYPLSASRKADRDRKRQTIIAHQLLELSL